MGIKNTSVIKRIKVTQRNRLRNKIYKSSIKTLTKKLLLYINTNENNHMTNLQLSIVYSKIDKAVKRGILSKNNASRKKSWLAKQLKYA
uniref:Small ribosomal subunit protein bS20c n=1 Tax=Boldia erythrosiphon TaxID=74908 RepID=A0A1Y9TLW7_9RHOD|nr:30S ribosomal protein S20 [Boldia erythrosiphon]ARO90626.1 30S ribosomal protein S20 [Boldia erythrosiphon]